MKSEFVMAINQICSERSLPQEVIFEAIESALVSAYRKNYGGGPNVKAVIDRRDGTPHVYLELVIVDQVEDDQMQISLAQARKIDKQVQLGELVEQDVTPQAFGRIAAQTAKQVILQRIREAERDALFSSYADREGELINGMVANVTSHAITLNLGRTEATMPRAQQVPGERYRVGQRVRAYVMEVRRASRGPQIIVSRTHRHMLRRLLELEVPEIYNGTVEIKAIAREAGSRSKVAVAALQPGVDPVGSCVGIRGMRIQSIVNELGGEKIDVVEWNADTGTFIANALSPAKVSYAVLGDGVAEGKTATVVVPDDQLSLAIGKEGQNARLAAKLTGWRIDIKSMSEAKGETARPEPATAQERDILAMAEAILLGKAAGKAAGTPAREALAAEPEPEPEAVSEPAPVQDAEPAAPEPAPRPQLSLLEQAEELLRDQAAARAREVAREPAETQPEPALAAPVEPGFEPAAPEAEVEPEPVHVVAEPQPAAVFEDEDEYEDEYEDEDEQEGQEEQAPAQPERIILRRSTDRAPAQQPRVRRPTFQYVRDEELESLEQPEKGKPSRKKKRRLTVDESTGKLVSRPRHKREDDPGWTGGA